MINAFSPAGSVLLFFRLGWLCCPSVAFSFQILSNGPLKTLPSSTMNTMTSAWQVRYIGQMGKESIVCLLRLYSFLDIFWLRLFCGSKLSPKLNLSAFLCASFLIVLENP